MAKAAVQEYLKKALADNSGPEALVWLAEQSQKITHSTSPNAFFLAFSKASRHFKKETLSTALGTLSLEESGMLPFSISHWDSLQAARTYLLLQLPQEQAPWMATVQQLFETADMYEQQALYAAGAAVYQQAAGAEAGGAAGVVAHQAQHDHPLLFERGGAASIGCGECGDGGDPDRNGCSAIECGRDDGSVGAHDRGERVRYAV